MVAQGVKTLIAVQGCFAGEVNRPKVDYFRRLASTLSVTQIDLILIDLLGGDKVWEPCEIIGLQALAANNLSEDRYRLDLRSQVALRAAAEAQAELTDLPFDDVVRQLKNEAFAFCDFINDRRIKHCLLWCQFRPLNIFLRPLLESMGITCAFVHLGILPGTLSFMFGGEMAESWICKEGGLFDSLPVSEPDVEAAKKYLSAVSSCELNRKPQPAKGLLKQSSLEHKSKTVLYVGINDYNSGVIPRGSERAKKHSPIYESTVDGLRALVPVARELDLDLLYKAHPNVGANKACTRVEEDWSDVVVDCTSANVFECLENSAVAVTILSQTAYLALIHDVPVLLLGNMPLKHKGCSYDVERREDLAEKLQEALCMGFTSKQRQAWYEHVARLWKYVLFSVDEGFDDCFSRGIEKARDWLVAFASVTNGCHGREGDAQHYELINKGNDHGGLSPSQMLDAAELTMKRGLMEAAERLVSEAYRQDAALSDGYARCAWEHYWPQREYDKVVKWMEKDQALGRLSCGWMLRLAQAKAAKGMFDEALEDVAHAYAGNGTLVDGYARCAWEHFWPRHEYAEVIKWLEKDQGLQKLSTVWQLNLAQAYAAKGDLDYAAGIVEAAYAGDESLRDGYARCAWHFCWSKQAYDKLIKLMEQDEAAGRLSPGWMLNLAQAYAAKGDLSYAASVVEKAYAGDDSLRDGYARCAWLYFDPKRAYSEILVYLDKEDGLGRLSSGWRFKHAEMLAKAGNIEASRKKLAAVYAADSSAMDGFARIGWTLFASWPEADFEAALTWMREDAEQQRLSATWRLKLARLCARLGALDLAIDQVELSYRLDAKVTDGFAEIAWDLFWLQHDYHATIKWMKKDELLGRLSGKWKLRLGQAYAASGELESAVNVVEMAYRDDPSLCDGYAGLGWGCLIRKDCEQGLRLWAKDRATERLSEGNQHAYTQVLKASEIKRELTYRLPAVLVGFPRSGTNFVQNVVQKSTGLYCSTLYSPLEAWGEFALTVKSHALSPAGLRQEWEWFLPGHTMPTKIILLARDPRDVMISFYEYVKAMRRNHIDQAAFMQSNYYYAASLDSLSIYESETLSVANAYRHFVDSWNSDEAQTAFDIMNCSYEDIIANPHEQFTSILRFLELDCPVEEGAINEKVSLYSVDHEHRAQSGKWQKLSKQYKPLLAACEPLLG